MLKTPQSIEHIYGTQKKLKKKNTHKTEKAHGSVTHDSLHYINSLTYLDTYLQIN